MRNSVLRPMPKWAAALRSQRTGVRNAKVLMIGDSTGAGYNSSGAGWAGNNRAHSPVAKLAALIPNANTDSLLSDANSGSAGLVTYDTRVTLGAGWSWAGVAATTDGTNPSYVLGGTLASNTTTTNAFSLTPVGAFDTIDFWFPYLAGNGTVTVDVDGGAALATINQGGSGTAFLKTTVSCSLGTHTININRVSGTCFMQLIIPYDSTTKSIQLLNGSGGAFGSPQFGASTWPWHYVPATQALAPDLTIICATINDIFSSLNTSRTVYRNNIKSLLDTCLLSGDVIMCVGMASDPTNHDIAQQQKIVDEYYGLANAYGINVVDLIDLWGQNSRAQALGYGTSDGTHVSDAGNVEWASKVANLMLAA